jgi:large subunit ribosomal protein L9
VRAPEIRIDNSPLLKEYPWLAFLPAAHAACGKERSNFYGNIAHSLAHSPFIPQQKSIPMATVELILKSKVENLGSEADIVTVRPGYARNFLIPLGLAAPATAASKKQIESLRRRRAEREAAELNGAQEIASKLNKVKLTFILTAGEGSEKVFGSVTTQDIANRLAAMGHEIERRKIDLPKDIKGSGTHEVGISLGHGVTGKITVIVEHKSSEAEAEAADAEKGGKGFAKKGAAPKSKYKAKTEKTE